VLDWYFGLFRDERMREVDPFGYGMGLAFGYVIIPGAMVAVMAMVIVLYLKSRRAQ
jgi:hypothetical protein